MSADKSKLPFCAHCLKVPVNKKRNTYCSHACRAIALPNVKHWKGKKRPPFSLEWRKRISEASVGRKCSLETRQKMGISHKKTLKNNLNLRARRREICKVICKARLGVPLSEEHKKKLSLSHLGKMAGDKNPCWISDRTKLKRFSKQGERRSPAYFDWRKQVWKRDSWKCRIYSNECIGRIEAHHILGWTEYPEFRYQINNGITLCHAHHPRKRAEEKRLQSEFQALVSVPKVNFVL